MGLQNIESFSARLRINSELRELKQLAEANGFAGKRENIEEKPIEDHIIKEGKIAELEHVSGFLDDDDLEEYNDFQKKKSLDILVAFFFIINFTFQSRTQGSLPKNKWSYRIGLIY
ncbi:hypothetical protein [Priestia megaterium]|uniref:hypothetical protein n=1 Tax=Priestia megaterium TaxID=1404 RepID=UPI000A42276D|nr:hypothetical protein [Priestia megaterium]